MLGSFIDTSRLAAALVTLLSAIAGVWALVRFVVRPLFDETVFNAWKRKSPDVERHMRDTIFLADLKERAEMKQTIAAAVIVANANASALADMVRNQAQAITLLSSIPHMAGVMEGFGEQIDRMYAEQRATNTLVLNHAERISAHSAILNEEGSGRRHNARRLGDPPPMDDGDGLTARGAIDG